MNYQLSPLCLSHHHPIAANLRHRRRHRHRKTMMHMTFYWGTKVTILFNSWKTNSSLTYSITLLSLFLFSLFYQYMEDRRLKFKLLSIRPPSSGITTPLLSSKCLSTTGGKWSPAKFSGAVLFGINSSMGYFLMLAITSFNAGVFIAVVGGLAVGYLVFRSGDDEQVVVVDNLCTCA